MVSRRLAALYVIIVYVMTAMGLGASAGTPGVTLSAPLSNPSGYVTSQIESLLNSPVISGISKSLFTTGNDITSAASAKSIADNWTGQIGLSGNSGVSPTVSSMFANASVSGAAGVKAFIGNAYKSFITGARNTWNKDTLLVLTCERSEHVLTGRRAPSPGQLSPASQGPSLSLQGRSFSLSNVALGAHAHGGGAPSVLNAVGDYTHGLTSASFAAGKLNGSVDKKAWNLNMTNGSDSLSVVKGALFYSNKRMHFSEMHMFSKKTYLRLSESGVSYSSKVMNLSATRSQGVNGSLSLHGSDPSLHATAMNTSLIIQRGAVQSLNMTGNVLNSKLNVTYSKTPSLSLQGGAYSLNVVNNKVLGNYSSNLRLTGKPVKLAVSVTPLAQNITVGPLRLSSALLPSNAFVNKSVPNGPLRRVRELQFSNKDVSINLGPASSMTMTHFGTVSHMLTGTVWSPPNKLFDLPPRARLLIGSHGTSSLTLLSGKSVIAGATDTFALNRWGVQYGLNFKHGYSMMLPCAFSGTSVHGGVGFTGANLGKWLFRQSATASVSYFVAYPLQYSTVNVSLKTTF